MMKRLVLLFGLLCAVLVTGCPYSSKVPLAVPSDTVRDDRLVGEWAGADGEGDSMRIVILPFHGGEYYAELRESDGTQSGYRVFAFDVGGARLLHINELSADREPAEYVFARYALSGDSELALSFVGDKIVPEALATDRVALLAFLEQHLGDPALDDQDARLLMHRSKQ